MADSDIFVTSGALLLFVKSLGIVKTGSLSIRCCRWFIAVTAYCYLRLQLPRSNEKCYAGLQSWWCGTSKSMWSFARLSGMIVCYRFLLTGEVLGRLCGANVSAEILSSQGALYLRAKVGEGAPRNGRGLRLGWHSQFYSKSRK